MLTPRFRVVQCDESVTLFIHAPYTDVNESEIHVDTNQVCFFAKPYYLRLHLPGPVVEDDKSKGTFDVDAGDYVVTLSKCNKGQKFENLDMLNSLIKAPSGKKIPNIEVLGDTSCGPSSSEFSDFDWFIDQEIVPEPEKEIEAEATFHPTYGFANSKSCIFKPLEGDLPELLDFTTPDETPNSEREILQLKWEDEHFSPEHFLADWAEEDELILPLLSTPLPWQSDENVLTADEQERLLRLPKIDILELNISETKSALLGLAELIFCWCHEQICSLGDTSPESARSIRRLSATLSWLRSFSSARNLVLTIFRRALCVPLYRHWKLAETALEHTVNILKQGRLRLLKCLLGLHSNFSECESYHIHSQLYLEPYCIWLQTVPEEHLSKLAAALEKCVPQKAELGWDLDELEAAGKVTLEEEKTTLDILTQQLKSGLHIKATETDSDDTSDSDWDTASTSSESSSELEESSCSNEED